jgi:hypothetical protein
LSPRLSAFGDYKLSFSSNDADLKGGGTLETDIGRTISSSGSLTASVRARAKGVLISREAVWEWVEKGSRLSCFSTDPP